MKYLTWDEFKQVQLCVGKIIDVQPFPKARKPSYKIWADFGPEIGIKKSSAQITALYQPEDLIGKLIIGVLNFPPKQIADVMSEFLLTGFYKENGDVILAVPDKDVPLGSELG